MPNVRSLWKQRNDRRAAPLVVTLDELLEESKLFATCLGFLRPRAAAKPWDSGGRLWRRTGWAGHKQKHPWQPKLPGDDEPTIYGLAQRLEVQNRTA